MATLHLTVRRARVRNFLSGFRAVGTELIDTIDTTPLISLRERREMLEMGPYGPPLPFIQPMAECARPSQCRNGGQCQLSI